jgi:hypothetical protein
MARTKITAYVTPDIAETIRRLAAIDDRSMSDIIEDAILRRLSNSGREAEHAALMARLDQFGRALRRIELGQETHVELTAQAARFALSVAPEIPEADLPTLEARGSDRLRNILSIVIARLAADRSVCREALGRLAAGQEDPAQTLEAAE